MCTITAAAVFALQPSVMLDTQQNGWNPTNRMAGIQPTE